MAWYYGVNNSDLYGSNFSTVLADAPPPLDDTEEEDNDIVFRNHGKKVDTQVSQNISPVQKKLNSWSSSDEANFGASVKPQSAGFPLSGQTPVKQDSESQGDVDLHSDFGDFTGFADFDSAFGEGNGEETSNAAGFNSEESDVLPHQADIVTNGETEVRKNQGKRYCRESVDCTNDQNNLFNDRSTKDPGVDSSCNQNKKNIGYSSGGVNSIDYKVGSSDALGDSATKTSNEGTEEVVPSDQTGTPDSKGSVSGKRTVDNTLEESSADKWKNDRENKQCNFAEFRGSDEDFVNQDEEINSERTLRNGDSSTVNKNALCSKDVNTMHIEDRNFKGFSAFCNETSSDPGGVAYCGCETSLATSRIENAKSSQKQVVDAYCMQGDDEKISENDNRLDGVILKDECNHSVALLSKEESLKPKQNDFGTKSALLAANKSDSGTIEGSERRSEADRGILSSRLRDPNCHLESTKVNSETKTIADESEPQGESTGNFADFSGFTDNRTANMHEKQNSSNLHNENVVDVTVENQSTVKLEQNNESFYCKTLSAESADNSDFGDFSSFDSRPEKLPEEGQMDDGFGEFGTFNSDPGDLTRTGSNSGEFGDFGTFTSQSKVSLNEYDREDNLEDQRVSGSQLSCISKNLPANDTKLCSSPEDKNDDGSGDFSAFDSKTEDLSRKNEQSDEFGDFGAFVSKTKDLSEKNTQSDSFGDFGSFDSKMKDSSKKHKDAEEFGDFGVFDLKSEDSLQKDHQSNEFGEQANVSLKANVHEDYFGEFNAFGSQPKSLVVTDLSINSIAESNVEAVQTDDDFGDFGNFESGAKCNEDFGNFRAFSYTKGDTNTNPDDDDNNFGDFNGFSSSGQSKNIGSGSDEGFGNFSDANINDSSSGFAEFASYPLTNSSEYSANKIDSMKQQESLNGGNKVVSVSSQGVADVKLQSQQLKAKEEEGTLCIFTPGGNVILTQAGKPVSFCFPMLGSLTVKENSCIHDVLPNVLNNATRSDSQIWRHLETPEEEEKVIFSWPSSFSKHKKLISLNMRPDRPPLQVNSLLMPTIMGSGGGLGGSILTPDRTSKLPHFTAGLGLLEPMRGLGKHTPYSVQNKDPSQSSSHPELALPDLSFILGAGLKRATSKSDIKDSVSDTTSESSSLDLDFFVPTSSVLSAESRSDSRGLYEDDLLGLNIVSSSEEFHKTDSPKIQRPPEAKKIWQHGGVTIPLTFQEKTTKLSAAAKRAIGQLEDLSFMNSSVLMFPLKSF